VIKETIPFDLLIKHRIIFAERFPYVFYLLLPVSLRNYFNSMKSEKNVYHEVYFVSNTSGFNPFEYCADLDGSFIQSISFGYHFGKFYEFPKFYLPKMRPLREIRILLIGNLNEHVPVSYNHKTKADEPAIKNHLLTESFRTIQFNLKAISNTIEIDVFNYSNGKRADIVEKLKQKSYNIIHIMNPLFFSETQPEKSYFITSDEQNLSIEQFQDAVESQIANRGASCGSEDYRSSLLVMDTELLGIKNVDSMLYRKKAIEIQAELRNSNFANVLMRIEPQYNAQCNNILTEFYRAYISNAPIGQSLNYGWAKSKANAIFYILFGLPWYKLW
jgi:hypothetical protein